MAVSALGQCSKSEPSQKALVSWDLFSGGNRNILINKHIKLTSCSTIQYN